MLRIALYILRLVLLGLTRDEAIDKAAAAFKLTVDEIRRRL
ncbi:MAG: hypothetical protein OWU32_13135 [Firmicutes bacterium]|nr:hypothetical protein [Bacillota bacterium]